MSKYVGKNVKRKEGPAKLTGQARYVDDISPAECLYGITLRSPVSRGTLKKIQFDSDFNWNGFTIVTAEDVPKNNVVALIESDQPCLASENISHREEPIVLVAHKDKEALEHARNHISFDIDPLPGVFTIDDSVAVKERIWKRDNVFKDFHIKKGDVSQVWDTADAIVEGTYRTGAQEQLYIETNGMIATYSKAEGLIVQGSMQCPYYVHKALSAVFDLPADKIRVIQTETGGGFGGKEEYPSILAAHTALLAMKSGKPVKMIYDRTEDMRATTKRHPSKTQIRSAWTKDGKILGADIDFVIDGGAYATLSSVVLSRGAIHAFGPYSCENVQIRARAVATNYPPHGAFRGFGAPQSIFAWERHLDEVAKKLKIDPVKLRKQNFVKKGQTTATGQLLKEEPNLDRLLDTAIEKTDYYQKQKQYAEQNKKGTLKRGIGLATFMHGAGFTGAGEKHLASVVDLEVHPDATIHVFASSTEIGQGTNTIFSQITADALGVPYESIHVVTPDTAQVPDSGPTVASRTCMIVGKLVQRAADKIREKLGTSADASFEQFQSACSKLEKPVRVSVQYQQPTGLHWDEVNYCGDAYATYAWAVYVADVEIDLVTYETQIKDFVAVQEVGKVMHPTLAAGQIEGGVAQGIGYAIYEKVKWNEGTMANAQMTNYIMPTALDLPTIRVFFEEQNAIEGPSGGKGIGELPMDGPGPAIINAVNNALGTEVNEIPMLPENLMEALS